MAIDNMTLPTLMADLGSGEFGTTENRQSRYGALNLLYNSATKLFGEKLIRQIRSQPLEREIKIPIFAKQDHTVLTTRTCDIVCGSDTTTLKTLTRTHFAVDICIKPSDYYTNYVTMEQALKQRFLRAFIAVYTLADAMAAAYVDSNKSTNIVADVDPAAPANPLFVAKTGLRELKNSVQFYSYLETLMSQMDFFPPFADLANTIANAEKNVLNRPGGGTQLQTDELMKGAGIEEYEYSNRVAIGATVPTHYIMPIGTVGVVNIIDLDYQSQPEIGSKQDAELWAPLKNLLEVKTMRQMTDPIYPDWKWGVLQHATCDAEKITYKVKFSMDLCFGSDFTSTTGLTPIQKFTVKSLYQPGYPVAA